MEQQLFTFDQLSRDRWGGNPSVWTIRRAADRNEIKTIYIGARRFVPLSEVLRIEQFGLGKSRRAQGSASRG